MIDGLTTIIELFIIQFDKSNSLETLLFSRKIVYEKGEAQNEV